MVAHGNKQFVVLLPDLLNRWNPYLQIACKHAHLQLARLCPQLWIGRACIVCELCLTIKMQVATSLTLANWLTHYLWSKGLDPDLYAMPIQSSLVDLIGQCALVLTYELATTLGCDMLARDLK